VSRPRIFLDIAADDGALVLEGPHHHYLTRVRRLPLGSEVEVVRPCGSAALYRIVRATGDRVRLAFEARLPRRALPGVLTLVQPLLTRKKLELAVQKATELGVDRIRITPTARSVALWKNDERGARLERVERIVLEASRQARRDAPPALDLLDTLDGLGEPRSGERRILLAEEPDTGGLVLEDLAASSPAPAAVAAAGPEGGFSSEELDALRRAGFEFLHLGPLVLRTETASVLACVAGGLALGRYARCSTILLDTENRVD